MGIRFFFTVAVAKPFSLIRASGSDVEASSVMIGTSSIMMKSSSLGNVDADVWFSSAAVSVVVDVDAVAAVFSSSCRAFSFSRASTTFSSKPVTSRRRRQGSTAIWKTRKRRTFTPIRPHVPQVLIRRILSDHTCSSW